MGPEQDRVEAERVRTGLEKAGGEVEVERIFIWSSGPVRPSETASVDHYDRDSPSPLRDRSPLAGLQR